MICFALKNFIDTQDSYETNFDRVIITNANDFRRKNRHNLIHVQLRCLNSNRNFDWREISDEICNNCFFVRRVVFFTHWIRKKVYLTWRKVFDTFVILCVNHFLIPLRFEKRIYRNESWRIFSRHEIGPRVWG